MDVTFEALCPWMGGENPWKGLIHCGPHSQGALGSVPRAKGTGSDLGSPWEPVSLVAQCFSKKLSLLTACSGINEFQVQVRPLHALLYQQGETLREEEAQGETSCSGLSATRSLGDMAGADDSPKMMLQTDLPKAVIPTSGFEVFLRGKMVLWCKSVVNAVG